MRMGFIGLGHMGGPMCARVVGGGFEVSAFDLRPEAVEVALAAGATPAASAAECAATADVLVTMLPGSAARRGRAPRCRAGPRRAPDGALAIDMSTSSPALGRRIAEAAAARGIGFLDAPWPTR